MNLTNQKVTRPGPFVIPNYNSAIFRKREKQVVLQLCHHLFILSMLHGSKASIVNKTKSTAHRKLAHEPI